MLEAARSEITTLPDVSLKDPKSIQSMIITNLMGGLGNQMFQYAAGLALAHRRRTVLKLDVSWYKEYDAPAHNVYGLHNFNIHEQFATQDEITHLVGRPLSITERFALPVARALHFHEWVNRHTAFGTLHRPPSFPFYPEFFDLPDNTWIYGYGGLQSEKFFAPIARIVRQHFSFRYTILHETAAMAKRIRSGPSAAIHIRRGDYHRDKCVLNIDYYPRAARLLRERSPDATFFIFSDDIDAVEREFTPPGPHVFVRNIGPQHPWEILYLMSLCDHIAIANSTFSWWAAWLNPSPTKLVIAPDPWFVGEAHDTKDVVPATWTRITYQ